MSSRPWAATTFSTADATSRAAVTSPWIALAFAPIVLGPLGAIFGFVGYSKGDRRGKWVGIGSIVTTIVGIAIGIAVLHAAKR